MSCGRAAQQDTIDDPKNRGLAPLSCSTAQRVGGSRDAAAEGGRIKGRGGTPRTAISRVAA
eukprot:3248833-Prymnesium_polylepis.1